MEKVVFTIPVVVAQLERGDCQNVKDVRFQEILKQALLVHPQRDFLEWRNRKCLEAPSVRQPAPKQAQRNRKISAAEPANLMDYFPWKCLLGAVGATAVLAPTGVPIVLAPKLAIACGLGQITNKGLQQLMNRDQKTEKEDEDPEIQEQKKRDELDAYVLDKLEKGDCKGVDLESFKNLVEEAFGRHPERRVFLEVNYRKCLNQGPWDQVFEVVKNVDLVSLGGYAFRTYEEWKNDRSKSQKEKDEYALKFLEQPTDCSSLNGEELKSLMADVFGRHPAQAVLLRGQYEKCLEQAKKSEKNHA